MWSQPVRSNARRRLRDSGRDLPRHRQQAAADARTRTAALPDESSRRTTCTSAGAGAGSRRGTESAEEAARLFEQVIAIDPAFAPAHAGLAEAYAVMSWAARRLSADAGTRRHAACRRQGARARSAARRGARRHGHHLHARAATGRTPRSRSSGRSSSNPNLSRDPYELCGHDAVAARQGGESRGPYRRSDDHRPTLARGAAATSGSAQFARRPLRRRHREPCGRSLTPIPTSCRREHARTCVDVRRDARGSHRAVGERSSQPGNWERWLTPAYVMLGRRAGHRPPRRAAPEQRVRIGRLSSTPRSATRTRTFEALNRAVDDAPHAHRVAVLWRTPRWRSSAATRGSTHLKKRLKPAVTAVTNRTSGRSSRCAAGRCVTGRRNDAPDDQTAFCSGFALRQLKTSRNTATRPLFSRTAFSILRSTSVMWSMRRLPTGSMSTVTRAVAKLSAIRRLRAPERLP